MVKIEIHAYFKDTPTEREKSNIDYVVCRENLKNYCFATPDDITDTDKEYIVLSFLRKDFSPYLPIKMLEFFLDKYSHLNKKILTELYFYCIDINLSTGKKNIISLNQANMNSFTYQSRIFYYDTDDIFYYTYEKDGLHIVWIENTETITNKVRLIEKKGFKGIFIRDVPLALDGNWESLYKIKHTQKAE